MSDSRSDPPQDRLGRLGDAVEAFLQRPRGTAPESREEFLDQHSGLRDLLEPMVHGADAAGLPSRRRFGDYELLRELGRGGMGVVYEARQPSLERHVALKVLSDPLALAPRKVERFRREAAAIARLRHPAIVPVYDVGTEEGLHWFAMELVEGHSLAELLERARGTSEGSTSDSRHRRPLGIRPRGTYATEAAEVCAELALALEHAHQHGLLHRDVKPANIMVSGERVLLLDFGLAKDMEKESLSRTGDFAGTPHYMSPEQATGSRDLDARSDVFSLGVVLYEMLTLRRPFESDTTHALLSRIAHADPVAPRRLQPGIPRELETICLKALERSPDARYASAAALAGDLQRFLAHEPIEARAPGPVTRTLKLARRKPAATTAMVLAFLLLAVAPLFFVLYFKSARDELREEQARTEQARKEAVSLLERLRDEQKRTEAARSRAETNLEQLEKEKARTEDARARAELYLGKAREVVDRMLERASEGQVRATKEMASVYEGMLVDALTFYREFLEARPDDPALQRTAAEAFGYIGRVQRLLGRSKASRETFAEALALFEAGRGPGIGDPAVRKNIAALLDDQAQVLVQLGERERAIQLVRQSLAEYRQMAKDFPDPPWNQRAVLGTIVARTNLANLLLRDAQKLDEALRLHEEALAAFDRVPDEERRVPPYASKEAQTRNSMGALLFRTGKLPEARRALDAAMEIRARIVESHPMPVYRMEYGESLLNLSELLERTEPERAVGLLERAIAIFTRLKTELPTRPEFRNYYARSSGKIAQILARLQRAQEAQPHWENYVRTARRLVRDYPANLVYRRELGFALTGYCMFLGREGAAEQSQEILNEAMTLSLELGTERPTDFESQQLLSYVLLATARIYEGTPSTEGLATFRHRALALRRKVRDPRAARLMPGPSLASWHVQTIRDWVDLGRHVEAFEVFVHLDAMGMTKASQHVTMLRMLATIVRLGRGDEELEKATRLERIDRYERKGVEILARIQELDRTALDDVDWSFLAERPEIRRMGLEPKAEAPKRRAPEKEESSKKDGEQR